MNIDLKVKESILLCIGIVAIMSFSSNQNISKSKTGGFKTGNNSKY
jgi:hypothetical protein